MDITVIAHIQLDDAARRLCPGFLPCVPIKERFSAASWISQPASTMLSVDLLLMILQFAPMEAYGPMTEFLDFSRWMNKGGRNNFHTIVLIHLLFCSPCLSSNILFVSSVASIVPVSSQLC